MRKAFLFLSVFCISSFSLLSQIYISTHHEELKNHKESGMSDADYVLFNETHISPKLKMTNNCTLNKVVFGWHPYWSNGLQNNYEWNLLSDLSYFAYEVNPSTGNASNIHGWDTASVVTLAQANNVRVNLCVTLFSSHATFFASSTAQQTLITNLITKVQQRNANGVNIDFEAVPSGNKTDLTNFMINLCNQMHTAIPGSQISMALPAVDWSGTYDVTVLYPYVDLFLIMGYDYYYNGSSQAGPTDPLYTHVSSYNYNLSKSITYYLNKNVPHAKLALGLPYFGKEWVTTSVSIPANTDSTGVSRTYKYIRDNSSGNYSNPVNYLKSMSTYHVFNYSGKWRQCFIDDAHMMYKRFDMVNQRNLAGIGIWALGYDDGYNDLWQAIADRFSDCALMPCVDTIYDMGGPDGNYYNNENYTYTIAPTNASGVTLSFSAFNVTSGSDTLKIYDGYTTNDPLIGAYTGSASPGTINSNGNALTLSFKSGSGTTAAGWQAIWTCTQDTIAPVTSVILNNLWVNSDFTASFIDTDNVNGSGIDKRFYQVSDFNGTTWDANTDRGFLYDNFNSFNNQLWTVGPNGGTWSVNSNMLQQTDETNSNTNVYAPLNQTLSNRYLYHFNAKMEGSGTNKRFGFHFFCDSAQYTNRKNSYFVWFRQATDVAELYKVVNDTFSIIKSFTGITTVTGQWYDFKIVYDRITGEINMYRDNALIGSHTDANPYSTGGNYISFRSGNCQLYVDSINVYRTRTSFATITVGNSLTKDVRFESTDIQTYAGKIKSVVNDVAENLSFLSYKDFYVDYSLPASINFVNDGTTSDIDTVFSTNTLSANWTASADSNTGIVAYWYAIGTSPGDTNILSWTNNGINLSVTHTGLNLVHNTTYFVSVKAQNGAGFYSNIFSSDGQMAYVPSAVMALFSYSNDSVCAGDSIVFSNLSLNANTYLWHFMGGQPDTSTAANPVVVYTTPGVYQVELIAYGNVSSDTLTLNALIHVFQCTVAGFNCPDTVYLPDAFVTFSNTSLNALTYHWDFGDGTSSDDYSPWHLYTSEGLYTVTLQTTNNSCNSVYSKNIAVLTYNGMNSNNYSIESAEIFPNPFRDVLYVNLNNTSNTSVEISLTDILGRKINNTGSITINQKNNQIIINQGLADLGQGVYILKISTCTHVFKYCVIKN